VVVVLGPLCAAGALLVGRLLGAALGMVGGAIAMAVLAIVLWIAIATWRNGSTGAAAAAVWMFAGAMNVNAGNSLALLDSGEHVIGAHIAEVAAWRGHDRVTFGDSVLREDLMELAGHIAKHTDGHRATRFDSCEATPIVAESWKPSDPVKLWALDDRTSSLAFSEQTFHVAGKPDGDCARAIEDVVAKHRVVVDADPIYLERVITSTDRAMVKLGGLAAAGLSALVWLAVLAWRWIDFQRYRQRKARQR